MRFIHVKNKLNKSFLLFFNRINDFIENNNFVVSNILEFNRFYKYNGKKISLGAILFDDLNKQLIIYETFIYKDRNIICIPDIRLFKYSDIKKCVIKVDNKIININQVVDNNYSKIKLIIETNNDIYTINFLSVNDINLFINICVELKKLMEISI